MASIDIIDFVSSCCKHNIHEKCHGKWQGLGFDFNCNCMCHNKKLSGLAEVVEPEANTTNTTQPPKEVFQR